MSEKSIQTQSSLPLSCAKQWLFAILSFFLVAFGQPAWLPWCGILAAIGGYMLFWRVLLAYSSYQKRFWLAAAWFCAVQLVQYSWFISHPYIYIYAVYFLLCLGLGLQFGIIGLFISPSLMRRIGGLLAVAGLWTLMEWSRLFVLSGISWNPVGLSLTSDLYALQLASLTGVFGLSFWVILVNLLGLRAWLQKGWRAQTVALGAWLAAASIPYLYGAIHLSIQEQRFAQDRHIPSQFTALLVQTAFSTEESQSSLTKHNLVDHVLEEWRQILRITKKHQGQPIDLIVLPEFVVPFGTYTFVYPAHAVFQIFVEELGPSSIKALPSLKFPFSALQKTAQGSQMLVDNAYWAQALANHFQASVLIGLEDAEDVTPQKREYYSSALLFHPRHFETENEFSAERYEKRILVPMGEYIPFEFCKNLAAKYGVFGSFTKGKEAKAMSCKGILLSPSICYEETFGEMMREGRQKGAELFVNLTSDVWYPNSKLPQQHFDHARLRTVENGIPLIRACNTGVTGAVDSLGRTIAILGDNKPEEVEWVPDSLLVAVPTFNYSTLYSIVGDKLIIGFSLLLICCQVITFFNQLFKRQ